MNGKTGKSIVAIALAILVLATLGQTAHAQSLTARYDRASYVPGDSGTLTVTVVNTSPTDTVEIRNLTVYFPWAELVDGKWPSGANVSINLSPWKTLGSSSSGSNTYTNSFSFTIPSWFPAIYGAAGNCPGNPQTRYGLYTSCILVGVTATPPGYESLRFGITMASAFYTPSSLTAEWLPIATLVALGLTTAFMALTWINLRRASKKA
jgi:hypothetical protein